MDERAASGRRGRGNDLLLAHVASLDPDTRRARDRLDAALGPQLAHKLMFALSFGATPPRSFERRIA
jgi:hypothetical protein